ncbi:hydrogen peroxide-inducible genes activator [Yunchengibacter salinarum]|uniref:hydrogen peroxide-inducible genes activator n=1 Tax=Yunchengibacter salinarum TaxID=3133399 RepID=UPI0035B68303
MEPTIRQMKYFLTVAKAGSFRGAAERLGVSQPTLTAQISALEQSLAVTLLERSRRGAIPTALGRDLIGQAESVLHEYGVFIDRARSASDGPAGTHRLGVPPTLGPYFLPEVITDLHAAYPNLSLYVREDTPSDLENKLIDGRHDLILVSLPLDTGELSYDPLFEEPLRLAAPPDHPLSAKKSITGADLKGEKLLAIEERYRFFEQVKTLADRFGAHLMRDYEGTSLDTLRQMIGMGMGLAFLPALYVKSEIEPRSDVAVLDIDTGQIRRQVVLAWRRNSPHRQLYREIARLMRRICYERLQGVVIVSS